MESMHEHSLIQFLLNEQAYLYRMAYSYLKDQDDALDAVQATACRALEHQGALRDSKAVRTWVTRILINICRDMLRQRQRLIYVSDEQLDQENYNPSLFDDTLKNRVEQLPFDLRVVIQLRFYNEMSLKEISAVTRCNLSTVKTRLYTGLKRLRIELEGDENNG